MTIIEILPYELIEYIYSYLWLPKDSFRFSLVNKHIRRSLPKSTQHIHDQLQRFFRVNSDITAIKYKVLLKQEDYPIHTSVFILGNKIRVFQSYNDPRELWLCSQLRKMYIGQGIHYGGALKINRFINFVQKSCACDYLYEYSILDRYYKN